MFIYSPLFWVCSCKTNASCSSGYENTVLRQPVRPPLSFQQEGSKERNLHFSGIVYQIIPSLCEKAGIPKEDERGAITSHRARATLATLLYNATDGLSIFDLKQWLGHKDVSSTQHYARVKSTKLAVVYANAERNSRFVEALVDTKADVNGEGKVYYVLGDHGLCGNPDWTSCLYRMACIKCPFFVPKERVQLIAASKTVKRFLEVVALTDEAFTGCAGRCLQARRSREANRAPSCTNVAPQASERNKESRHSSDSLSGLSRR